MIKLPQPSHRQRLEKLADSLLQNDISPKIRAIKEESKIFRDGNTYIGQLPIFFGLIMELPSMFPKEWLCSEDGCYYWIGDPSRSTIKSLRKFFGLDLAQILHVFVPGGQVTQMYGGNRLSSYSSSKDIGMNIVHMILAQRASNQLLSDINTYFSDN